MLKSHKINGFEVIACVTDLSGDGTQVIAAVRKDAATGRPVEYVTARVRCNDEAPTEWHAGHYIGVRAADPHQALLKAYASLLTRSHASDAIDAEREGVLS